MPLEEFDLRTKKTEGRKNSRQNRMNDQASSWSGPETGLKPVSLNRPYHRKKPMTRPSESILQTEDFLLLLCFLHSLIGMDSERVRVPAGPL